MATRKINSEGELVSIGKKLDGAFVSVTEREAERLDRTGHHPGLKGLVTRKVQEVATAEQEGEQQEEDSEVD